MAARAKQVLKRHARTAFVFHATVFASTLAGSYAAIRQGIDLPSLATRVPFVDLTKVDPDAGTLALAYLSTVATGPVRGALTIAATPLLARVLARSRLLHKR
ncbi:unnamed protein product [Hyaloperonospora brassicae]|uniref:DUF1279 domain-containing protein n=1 Tax=Hyaloperonospora brassicae TaxID=162125 RepID=A0AAV0TTJ6_HYABA|nr:unnamed protein product [Hyaloperonospora brassicae]